jgi:NADH-quinone oxidoreductase subunit E
MLRGAEDIRAVCERKIHPEPFHTNAEGTLSWEEVECMGACVNAPTVAIFHDTYEDLTPERMEEIIDAFAAGRGDTIPPGPQVRRQFSEPEGGPVTLIEMPGPARERASPMPPPPAAPEPTTPGREREVPEEAAPAIRTPGEPAKVSTARAEAERKAASGNPTGEPARAMRPDAVGAESPAGKLDEGRAPGKADGAPAPLFDAPAGPADDLKLISGVGPVLERALNGIGITTWAQVARLTEEQIDTLESALRFRGRVKRDNWLGQADALASGGVAEYVKRFGKDPR